ncbi:MAG: DnaJ domain-containing protein [Clostridiales bacterium]|jgi:chaperone protein dnaJ 2|nr:DnaJ domain-containing protein [Clostridiales bacterium]
MITYYEILEVSRMASKEVITKAYKVLVRKYHPDLEQDEGKKEEAKEKMVRINEAYETLSDDEKRKKYDDTIAILEEKERIAKEKERQQSKTQNINNNRNINVNKNTVDVNTNINNIDNRNNLNNDTKLQEEMQRAEEEIQMHKQNIVNQMYEDYYNTLRRMGYNVVTVRPLKERIKAYLIAGIVIILLILIYNIPFIRGFIYSKAYGTVFELPVKLLDVILTLPIRMIRS